MAVELGVVRAGVRLLALGVGAFALFATAAAAQTPSAAPAAGQQAQPVADIPLPAQGLEQWLQHVSAAARSLNYSGVFITQRGDDISTSSLVHYVLPQGHFERIETLDGQRRIMVSLGDQVRTTWPDYRLMLIDNQGGQTSFPRLLKTAN
ncbi:MAG: sigma-E factor regulatory protein RseB domain-containing protein, partial [Thiomonas sp.]